MIDDGQKRLNAVKRLNGALASLTMARERARAAEATLGEIECRQGALRVEYSKLCDKLSSFLGGMAIEGGAAKRVEVVKAINEQIAAFDTLEPAIAKAKSEQGTAAAEVARFEVEAREAETQLLHLIPGKYRVSV